MITYYWYEDVVYASNGARMTQNPITLAEAQAHLKQVDTAGVCALVEGLPPQ